MVTACLLGNAQDAGLPQAGCACANCRAAWADPARRRWATALALLDTEAGEWFLVDATPDFREQLHFAHQRAPEARLAGVLITHAHLGHYTGLMHLGFEAMATRGLPLYGTRRFNDFMRTHAPWRQLVEMQNVALRELPADGWLTLTPRLSVKPVPVPHRAEWSDTVGFIVRGPARQLLYIPDIDGWSEWEQRIEAVVTSVDVALLDGSFFSPAELPNRDLSKIKHPLVTETVNLLVGTSADVRFIHLNHSNPLHRAGPERAWLEARGLRVAQAGDEWEL